MKTLIKYFVLICLVIVAMPTTAFIVGSIIGFDSIGVKGLTAGAGLYIIYNRSSIFKWIDNRIFKNQS